jgi:hypothetical protein
MRPKLKEKPVEWLKFTLAMSGALAMAAILLWRRRTLSGAGLCAVLIILVLADLLCSVRPAWFRSFYRAGMTVSFYLGQVIGRILLTAFFVLVLVPFGSVLRWFGKDLLQIKKTGRRDSYWRPTGTSDRLDRQF